MNHAVRTTNIKKSDTGLSSPRRSEKESTMRVAVLREGKWMPSKHGEGQNKRVTFEVLEDHTEKYVYLNITDYEVNYKTNQSVKDLWEAVCKQGNVLNVTLRDTKNINKYEPFNVVEVKPVNGGQVS